jgi:hypothetical protein
VATDADYWPAVLGERMPPASLGEVELVANGLGGFDLGQVEPNTRYTIHHPDFEGLPHDLEFTTGAGPSTGDAPPKTVLESVREVPPIDDENGELCRAILHSQDCFDTGNPRYFQLLTGETPRAWLVQMERRPESAPIVLPPECIPSVWSYSDLGCVRVGVVTERGPSELSEWYCDGATSAPDASALDASAPSGASQVTTRSQKTTADADGCAVASTSLRSSAARASTGWGAAWSAIALYALRRRRRMPVAAVYDVRR